MFYNIAVHCIKNSNPMKKHICMALFIGFMAFNLSAQPGNLSQKNVADTFVEYFNNEEFDKCWKLFDRSLNPEVTKEQFIESAAGIYAEVPDKQSGMELFMTGMKFIGDYKAVTYSYKLKLDVSKPMPGFIVELLFSSAESNKVAGFSYRRYMGGPPEHASSSRGKETVVTKKETWVVDSVEYTIRGVNIIHFEKDTGLISVQVEQELPTGSDLNEWAYNSGIKFARYLYHSKTYSLALEKAGEQKLAPKAEIGVSFVNPVTGSGYNTIISKKDFE
jgi:hypothetical protein